ncbi:oligosaccharide flippase family protein [Bacteroides nordii]|jgi:polysaccharide biosynthesis protein|uniref:oligosaccharide flippase family protein n=1 Tax=Bacteroides nordii TaxID=291645 RepID=UPI001898C89D|nr:oligosaccharide flippase family protein [Bacteroides nordii]
MINFQLGKIFLNNKKVLENLSYISILQLFSIFLPLISYPYLIRVLGLELNGMIVFAYSIVSYLNLFISFGFNSSTTRNIASLESDKCISNIVFSTYLCKLILFSFSVCLFLLVISFSHIQIEFRYILYSSLGLSIGELLLPIWYFQGVEKMKYLTIINVGSRTLFTIFIFVFVRQKEDYLLVPLFNSLGAIGGGAYALYVLLAKERVKFSGVNLYSIKMNFRDSAPMFVSSLSSLIYLNVNKLIVGSFLGMSEVSIYDIGEKVMNLLKIPTVVICQSVYPKMSRELNIRYMNKVMLTAFFFMLVLYSMICIWAKQIIKFFLGEHNSTGVILICILSFSSVLLTLNSMLGGNRLIPFGYARQLMNIMIINLLFYVLLLSVIVVFDKISMLNLAICTLFVELICVIMLILKNRKLKILR